MANDHRENNWEKLTLLFNSLDQLSSRFPLCAKQDIFVPGLIDSLNGENVRIFVAVEIASQPLDNMAYFRWRIWY